MKLFAEYICLNRSLEGALLEVMERQVGRRRIAVGEYMRLNRSLEEALLDLMERQLGTRKIIKMKKVLNEDEHQQGRPNEKEAATSVAETNQVEQGRPNEEEAAHQQQRTIKKEQDNKIVNTPIIIRRNRRRTQLELLQLQSNCMSSSMKRRRCIR